MTAKELREKRAKLVSRMQELRDQHHDEKREWTETDQGNWDKINEEYNALTRQIEAAEASHAMDARMAEIEGEQRQSVGDRRIGRENRDGSGDGRGDGRGGDRDGDRDGGGPNEEDRTMAFAGWCRNQMGEEIDERHTEAAERCGASLAARQLRVRLPDTRSFRAFQRQWRSHHQDQAAAAMAGEGRALSGTIGGSGAAMIPESFVHSLEVAKLAFGGLATVADVIRTSSGEEMSWPTADDTSNEGARVGESIEVDSDIDPLFGATKWGAYKYTSKAVLVPFELLEDSAFDLPGILGGMLGERLGRITNRENTTGTGDAQPNGVVTAATVGKTTASSTAITADEIIQLEHSVDPAYRQDAGFMMHDSILLVIRLLKDNDGRYLWQSNIREGRPDSLLGRPLTINQNMAGSVVASAKTMLFGNFKYYKIREVNSVRLYRLEERFRMNDQDGFVAFLRQDGNLLNAGGNPIKVLLQA